MEARNRHGAVEIAQKRAPDGSPTSLHKITLPKRTASQGDWRGEAAPVVADAKVSSGLSAAISGAVELTRQRREAKLEKRRGQTTANEGDFGN